MKFKAVITTLVLGSSSVVMARPAVVAPDDGNLVADEQYQGGYGHEYRGEPGWRRSDERWDQEGWVTLTEPQKIERGRERFDISPESGRFNQLMIQSVGGRSFISEVRVRYAEGPDQRISHVDARLDRRNPVVTVNLDGSRRLQRVVVYVQNSRDGAVQILGR